MFRYINFHLCCNRLTLTRSLASQFFEQLSNSADTENMYRNIGSLLFYLKKIHTFLNMLY